MKGKQNLLLVVLCLLLIGVFVVQTYFAGESENQLASPREHLANQLEQTKKQNNLQPEQEILARIHLAVIDYRLRHGGVSPASVNDLVPLYFDSVPIDPVTKKPMQIPFSMQDTSTSPIQETNAKTNDGKLQCPSGLVPHPKLEICTKPREVAATPTPTPTAAPAPEVRRN